MISKACWVFKDIFNVKIIDPDGKKFDRVIFVTQYILIFLFYGLLPATFAENAN